MGGDHYIHKTATDTITTLPAVIHPTGTTATVGLKGNTVQNDTPTPDIPIMPQGCGERTGNLFDFEQLKNAPSGTIGSITFSHVLTLQMKANTYYTMASNGTGSTSSTPADLYRSIYFNSATAASSVNRNNPVTVLTDSTGVVRIGFFSERTNAQQYLSGEAQLWINEGSTPLPYEPYGYKIPISSANTTTPVYLGEVESTRRIKKYVFTGEENGTVYSSGTSRKGIEITGITGIIGGNADIAILAICTHYQPNTRNALYRNTDNGISNAYQNDRIIFYDTNCQTVESFQQFCTQQYAAGETAVVNEPLMKIGDYADEVSNVSIPVTAGGDTISVDTTVQPSEVTVNYKGWHPAIVHERTNGAWT